MKLMAWISGICIIAYIWLSLIMSSNEKHDLETRIVVLETKVAVLLEERK